MTDNRIIRLRNKIEKDYQILENQWLCEEKINLINNSFSIAVVQNFHAAILSYIDSCEKDDEFVLTKESVDIINNYNSNILQRLCDGYLELYDPERIDFWTNWYDGVADAVKCICQMIKED